MKFISKLKNHYNNIPIPPELGLKVACALKQAPPPKRIKYGLRWAIGVASCIVCIFGMFVAFLNTSPAFAQTMQDIPILKNVAQVCTFREYQFHEETYEADVKIPALVGLNNPDLEKFLNEELSHNAQEFITQFEQDVADLKAAYGEDAAHINIISDYQVTCNNDTALSFTVMMYYGAGSSNTTYHTYTIDQKTGQLLTLSDLFLEDSNFTEVLYQNIVQQMEQQMAQDSSLTYWIGENENGFSFKELDENHSFYLNEENQLVIPFDKYEVAPGYMGTPHFEISTESIASILKPDSILS